MSATNSYTVTLADAHSHTLVQTPVAIDGGEQGNTMAAKLAAAISALTGLRGGESLDLAAFTATDPLTITVTQP